MLLNSKVLSLVTLDSDNIFVPKYKLAQEIMAPSESTLFVLFERFDKQPLPSTMVQIWEEG